METLELSVFDHGTERSETLRALLAQFEARHNIKVQLDIIPWLGSWSRMVQVALYKDGPDVSEIGSTWIGDFSNMNALRAYSPDEIHKMGGQGAFLAPSWQSARSQSADFALWAMPWLADVRILAYRRDLYEQADIEVETALQSIEDLEQTLARLQAAGVRNPLVLPTLRSRLDIHIFASWIWAEGGDFFDPVQDRILFDQPEALRALTRYFNLYRFLDDEVKHLGDDATFHYFFEGQAATVIGGNWILLDARVQQNLRGKVGVTGVPPVSFVGGSHLVIWQHSRKGNAAFKLVQFLAGHDTPLELYPGFGFPARLDAIERASFVKQPHWSAMHQAIRQGRSIPLGRLWGMIEKRLVDLVPVIWHDIFTSTRPDVEDIVSSRITAMADRLRLTLKP